VLAFDLVFKECSFCRECHRYYAHAQPCR